MENPDFMAKLSDGSIDPNLAKLFLLSMQETQATRNVETLKFKFRSFLVVLSSPELRGSGAPLTSPQIVATLANNLMTIVDCINEVHKSDIIREAVFLQPEAFILAMRFLLDFPESIVRYTGLVLFMSIYTQPECGLDRVPESFMFAMPAILAVRKLTRTSESSSAKDTMPLGEKAQQQMVYTTESPDVMFPSMYNLFELGLLRQLTASDTQALRAYMTLCVNNAFSLGSLEDLMGDEWQFVTEGLRHLALLTQCPQPSETTPFDPEIDVAAWKKRLVTLAEIAPDFCLRMAQLIQRVFLQPWCAFIHANLDTFEEDEDDVYMSLVFYIALAFNVMAALCSLPQVQQTLRGSAEFKHFLEQIGLRGAGFDDAAKRIWYKIVIEPVEMCGYAPDGEEDDSEPAVTCISPVMCSQWIMLATLNQLPFAPIANDCMSWANQLVEEERGVDAIGWYHGALTSHLSTSDDLRCSALLKQAQAYLKIERPKAAMALLTAALKLGQTKYTDSIRKNMKMSLETMKMLVDLTPPAPVSADAAKRMATALSKAIEENKEAAEKLYTEMDTLCKSVPLEKKEKKKAKKKAKKGKATAATTKAEPKASDSTTKCSNCKKEDVSIALIPCGHHLCATCASAASSNCSSCSAAVDYKLRIWL